MCEHAGSEAAPWEAAKSSSYVPQRLAVPTLNVNVHSIKRPEDVSCWQVGSIGQQLLPTDCAPKIVLIEVGEAPPSEYGVSD